jgi:hypothetical protein
MGRARLRFRPSLPFLRVVFSWLAIIVLAFLRTSSHNRYLMKRFNMDNANHPVFGTPDTYASDPDLGQINYLAVQPRQCQLALKVVF